MADFFYFGCWDRAGHYLHAPGGRTVRDSSLPADFPCRPGSLDAGFLPPGQPQEEGRVSIWHGNGWTIMAFWDRSVDTRACCNSAFIGRGTLGFVQMVSLARTDFPTVMDRFKFKLSCVMDPVT